MTKEKLQQAMIALFCQQDNTSDFVLVFSKTLSDALRRVRKDEQLWTLLRDASQLTAKLYWQYQIDTDEQAKV